MEGKCTIPEGVVWQELDGQTVVVDPKRRATWVLNSTATRIWKEIGSGASVEAAARKIASALKLDAGRVLQEVASFCCELGQRGLLSNTSGLTLAMADWSGGDHILGPAPRVGKQAPLRKLPKPRPTGVSGQP